MSKLTRIGDLSLFDQILIDGKEQIIFKQDEYYTYTYEQDRPYVETCFPNNAAFPNRGICSFYGNPDIIDETFDVNDFRFANMVI